jgi:hypothetical protein
MSIVLSENLSEKAGAVLKEMESACSSEAASVVDALNTIAENGGENASDDFLLTCAEEIKGWTQHFIDRLRAGASNG